MRMLLVYLKEMFNLNTVQCGKKYFFEINFVLITQYNTIAIQKLEVKLLLNQLEEALGHCIKRSLDY